LVRLNASKPHWWQWFTILSLDATSVAVVWQWWFARGLQVPMRGPERFVLGASVWIAYTADRWIEALRMRPDEFQTQRHRFAARWRWPLCGGWLVVLAADLVVSFSQLSRRELEFGFILLGAVAAYLLSHQLYHRHQPWRLPKELCVALLITAGALLFPIANPNAAFGVLWLTVPHFIALCFINCLLISRWEREVDVVQGQQSLALEPQLSRAFRLVPLLPWLFALEGALLALLTPLSTLTDRTWSRAFFASIALAFVLLGVVDRAETRIGRQLARVLADVVLLTPLFFW
jgi:hypothetical protein